MQGIAQDVERNEQKHRCMIVYASDQSVPHRIEPKSTSVGSEAEPVLDFHHDGFGYVVE